MSISDVIHQDRAHSLVRRALASRRVPHAYIFHGPVGVGKETFARGLAKLLLCREPRRDPDSGSAACGQCDSCHTTDAGTHPDLHVIYRQLIKYHDDPTVRKRKGLELGVDVVRQFVIDRVGAKPVEGRAKVFLIREADRITPQAQNALLKTLEEPPDTTFLILLVSALDRLLPTTLSRCQLIPFGALPDEFVAEKLQELKPGLSSEQARVLGRMAQGSLGRAVEYAEDGIVDLNDRLVELLADLARASVAQITERLAEEADTLGQKYRQRDADITDTEAKRRATKTAMLLASQFYRDVLHTISGCSNLLANAGNEAALETAAERLQPEDAMSAIRQLAAAEAELDFNVNTKLALDHLAIELSRAHPPASPARA